MKPKTNTESERPGGVAVQRMVRRLYRALKAGLFPMRFADWVNAERCLIEITNDPDGVWHVRIGAKHPPQHGKTLSDAMVNAFLKNDCDNDWKWPSDYLREL